MPESISLIGASKRAVERRLFGDAMRVSMAKSVDPITEKLVRAYAKAWGSMQGIAAEMSAEAAEKYHAHAITPREVANLDRVDRAMFALERQVRELGRFTGVTVSGGASTGIGHVVSDVFDSLPSLTGIDRRFTKPSGTAIEGLILRSTEQIESSTRALTADQQNALKEGLFRGLVLGENPRDTARHVLAETKGAFFGGLSRATTIARTEIGDANRYATRLAYNDEELVVGWKWLASLSNRTCPACWSMHNTFHEKTEPMLAHQNCRCTMIPVLADDDPADHDLGDPEALFWALPREDQLAIMGPGRLKALEGGATFTDLSFIRHNPNWRPSVQVTAVADLLGLAELNVATTPGDVIEVPGLTNESILSYAFAQGGLTINTVTGDQPTSGYVVARKGTSLVVDAREFFGPAGPNAVAQWLTTHGDELDQPGAHMGMWYDTHNGKVVLDVVQILDDKDAAVALGRSEDQIAIFDLNTFSEIPTGGSGGYTDPIANGLKSGLRPSGVEVGRTVTATVDGEEFTGKVVQAPSYSDVTVIQTADGRTVRAWPDQITRVASADAASAEVDRIKALRDLSEQIHAATGIDRVNLAGMTVKDAQATADTIEALHQQYPDVLPESLYTGDAGSAFAVTTTTFPPGHTPTSDVAISQSYSSSPSTWAGDMREAEHRGHFHRGTSDEPQQYTVDHEFGHVLDFNLFGDPRTPEGDEARRQIAKDIFNNLEGAKGKHIDSTAQVPAIWNAALMQDVRRDLSGYATQEPAEMFAEAFAVYRDHGPGESIVADTVMRHFVRAYRQKYGHWPTERGLDVLFPGEYQPPEQGRLF